MSCIPKRDRSYVEVFAASYAKTRRMPLSDDTLTDHERMLLTMFLGERADAGCGMPISMVDGFLTAIISGPRMIAPSEWLPEAFSFEQLPAQSSGFRLNAEDGMLLIMRRYNEIARALAANNVDMLLAVADEDAGGADELLFGEPWCFGYLNGMSLDPKSWDKLFDDPEHATLLDDIYLLATPFIARNADGEIDPAKADAYYEFTLLQPQERSDIANNLPDIVLEIYQYWLQFRIPERSRKLGKTRPSTYKSLAVDGCHNSRRVARSGNLFRR